MDRKEIFKGKKLTIAIIITCVLVILAGFILWYFVFRGNNEGDTSAIYPRLKNEEQWVSLYNENSEELEKIATDFLNQDEYWRIQLQKNHNQTTCDYKSAYDCEAYAATNRGSIYDGGIKLDSSNDYVEFMKKYYIMFLTKDYYNSPGQDVWFTSGDWGQCGIVYWGGNEDLDEDSNLLVVTKIEDHWFYVCEDWN